MADLRAHLGDWIDVVREGNEVVVTERGIPVARIVGLDTAGQIEGLVDDGVIARPTNPVRHVAGAQSRPVPNRPVANYVTEMRREG